MAEKPYAKMGKLVVELDQRAYNARQRTLLAPGEVSTLTTVLNRAAGRVVLGLGLGVVLLAGGVPAGGAELLRPSDAVLGVEKRERLEADPFAMRWRVAGMESAEVFEPGAWGRPLALELFPDARVRARVRSAKTLPSGSSWLAGTLEGGGHFTLLRSAGGILRGEFHSARGVFTIRSQGAGRVLVEQRDVAKMRDLHHHHHDGHGHDHDAMPEQPPDKERRQRPAARPEDLPAVSPRAATDDEDDSKPVDILVVYTQRVEDYEGGPDEVIVTLENEIARMNQVLENSGLASRRVRGIFEKVDYEQAEHLGWDSANLENTEADNDEDGDYSALDEVFPLIAKHQADLVHLFVRDALRACGVAGHYRSGHDQWIQKDCENSENVELCLYNKRRQKWREERFGVTAVKCISNYFFPHELGHNLGIMHDRGAHHFRSQEHFDRAGPFKNYAFGYQNF